MALRRCTETLWCVRIIFLLESVVVLLWLLDMRRGERPGSCLVGSLWCTPAEERRATSVEREGTTLYRAVPPHGNETAPKFRAGGQLPRLLVLGGVRCGGAALFEALTRHADFVGRSQHFFDSAWESKYGALGDDDRCRAYESLYSRSASKKPFDIAVDHTASYLPDPPPADAVGCGPRSSRCRRCAPRPSSRSS